MEKKHFFEFDKNKPIKIKLIPATMSHIQQIWPINSIKPATCPICETGLKPTMVNPKKKEEKRYQCLLCGKDKFTSKTPHLCVGGYRKRNIKWLEI